MTETGTKTRTREQLHCEPMAPVLYWGVSVVIICHFIGYEEDISAEAAVGSDQYVQSSQEFSLI